MAEKTKRQKVDVLTRQIMLHKTAIGEHRDSLRELIIEARDLEGTADEAMELLEQAADKLSEYV